MNAIGWTLKAACPDPRVDGLCGLRVFSGAERFAREIGKAFAPPCALNPAGEHLEDERVFVGPLNGLWVDLGVV